MIQNQPVPPTMLMGVKLEAQQWNAVLMWLGKQPFENVATIIQEISEQLQLQAAAQPSNGLDLNERDRAAA